MNTLRISLTKNIPSPNIYIKMLDDYKDWIFLEEEAQNLRGKWLNIFADRSLPLDLEIGCGNGFFFEHQTRANPQRNLLGIEIKYKPLVQTVRRIRLDNLPNGRGLRFNARVIDQAFQEGELNNVFIYFPDPWPRRTQQKNRLLKKDFFQKLFKLQKSGSFVDIKTDSLDYFNFAESELKGLPYEVIRSSRDLHRSDWAAANFPTSFEKIFSQKGIFINYMRLFKN